MTEVRETTRRDRILERSVMSASVIPSAKNSCSESRERFASGRTASEVIARAGAAVALPTAARARRETTAKTRAAGGGLAKGQHPPGFVLLDEGAPRP